VVAKAYIFYGALTTKKGYVMLAPGFQKYQDAGDTDCCPGINVIKHFFFVTKTVAK
jgi:hypothetical protein